jgi:hypothetical protein
MREQEIKGQGTRAGYQALYDLVCVPLFLVPCSLSLVPCSLFLVLFTYFRKNLF